MKYCEDQCRAPHRPPARRRNMLVLAMTSAVLQCCLLAGSAFAENILFVGNSFTYSAGTPVQRYKPHSVTDLNRTGIGGVPALFKSFTRQAGLDYDVFLVTHPGIGIDWHLAHSMDAIGRHRWDTVVLQSFSMLDGKHPGDPALLVDSVKRMAEFLKQRNSVVKVQLMATWTRADQTYPASGHWYGQPVEAMANQVRAGYDKAAAATPIVQGVIPVGEAWTRAMRTGVADPNPYDGIDAGKVSLWNGDHYHASVYGAYLEALTIFGSITGRDPRSLGTQECAGRELGITARQIGALEQIAADQLAASGTALAALASAQPAGAADCAAVH